MRVGTVERGSCIERGREYRVRVERVEKEERVETVERGGTESRERR